MAGQKGKEGVDGNNKLTPSIVDARKKKNPYQPATRRLRVITHSINSRERGRGERRMGSIAS